MEKDDVRALPLSKDIASPLTSGPAIRPQNTSPKSCLSAAGRTMKTVRVKACCSAAHEQPKRSGDALRLQQTYAMEMLRAFSELTLNWAMLSDVLRKMVTPSRRRTVVEFREGNVRSAGAAGLLGQQEPPLPALSREGKVASKRASVRKMLPQWLSQT
jgi:hypothetical protein